MIFINKKAENSTQTTFEVRIGLCFVFDLPKGLRLTGKLYLWLKFITAKDIEQKQQEIDVHQWSPERFSTGS